LENIRVFEKMKNNQKICITGSNGFVGQNLQNFLNTIYDVVPLSYRYKSNQIIEISENVVIHLSGKAHDLKKVSQPQEYYEANFELTKQLFDTFLLSKASVFIFMSTVKAVADDAGGIIIEEAIPNPKTHYGISKLQAENYILNQKTPKGKRVYILRPCMIHGPGNKGNLNLLYKIISKNIPWPLGAFENKRSFCSIENLLFVIKELIEREDILSGIYNLADDESLSTNELIDLIAQSQNRKPNIWKIPKSFIERLANLGDVLHLPLNTERLHKLTESYEVSNQKIINAIGKPIPVSSRNGILKTFKSFKLI
jgi:nucleoside-diphosphate-sugar epimerase